MKVHGMTGSIGRKVIALLTIMGAVFLIAIVANIMAMTSIKDYNHKENIYLEMSGIKSDASTSFQQMQLYANLSYFKQYSEDIDIMQKKLGDSIEEMGTAMDNMGNLCEFIADKDVTAAYESWNGAVTDFSDYCTNLLADANAGNYDAVKTKIDSMMQYKTPVQDAEDAYDAVILEKSTEIQNRSTTKITQTYMFNIVLAIVFLLVLGAAVFVVTVTIARPAKKSGVQLQQIVNKIENNEGDLTERIPIKTSDEIGQMAQGINGFLEQLQAVMQKLKLESEHMTASVGVIRQEIYASNENASSVSVAMEEMSASMEEIVVI